jgi:hypothetical protein
MVVKANYDRTSLINRVDMHCFKLRDSTSGFAPSPNRRGKPFSVTVSNFFNQKRLIGNYLLIHKTSLHLLDY